MSTQTSFKEGILSQTGRDFAYNAICENISSPKPGDLSRTGIDNKWQIYNGTQWADIEPISLA